MLTIIQRYVASNGHREGGAQLQVSLYIVAELPTASRVSTIREVLKTSRLDDELIEDRQNWLWALPYIHLMSTHVTHVMNAPRPSPTLLLLCITIDANGRVKTYHCFYGNRNMDF